MFQGIRRIHFFSGVSNALKSVGSVILESAKRCGDIEAPGVANSYLGPAVGQLDPVRVGPGLHEERVLQLVDSPRVHEVDARPEIVVDQFTVCGYFPLPVRRCSPEITETGTLAISAEWSSPLCRQKQPKFCLCCCNLTIPLFRIVR